MCRRSKRTHDDEITGCQRANVGADRIDDADRLMSHATADLSVFHFLVWPQIAAADAGPADGYDGRSVR